MIGQLFTSGYFFDAKDTQPIGADLAVYCDKAAIVGMASSLLVVPLKLIISIFLTGKDLKETVTKRELEETEKKLPTYRMIGYFLIFFWLIGTGYAISMFAVNFNTIALEKWLIAFAASFCYEIIILYNVKMILKILFAVMLKGSMKFTIMLTIAGSVVSFIVDTVVKLV